MLPYIGAEMGSNRGQNTPNELGDVFDVLGLLMVSQWFVEVLIIPKKANLGSRTYRNTFWIFF